MLGVEEMVWTIEDYRKDISRLKKEIHALNCKKQCYQSFIEHSEKKIEELEEES